ncbi:hypothetical protein FB451DRAFT_1178036 [Mycena latifolia]|nr:hypothetical protein FB451DRAFT_1178036 [Mycena latifolia]
MHGRIIILLKILKDIPFCVTVDGGREHDEKRSLSCEFARTTRMRLYTRTHTSPDTRTPTYARKIPSRAFPARLSCCFCMHTAVPSYTHNRHGDGDSGCIPRNTLRMRNTRIALTLNRSQPHMPRTVRNRMHDAHAASHVEMCTFPLLFYELGKVVTPTPQTNRTRTAYYTGKRVARSDVTPHEPHVLRITRAAGRLQACGGEWSQHKLYTQHPAFASAFLCVAAAWTGFGE